jgi:hypothetical protein
MVERNLFKIAGIIGEYSGSGHGFKSHRFLNFFRIPSTFFEDPQLDPAQLVTDWMESPGIQIPNPSRWVRERTKQARAPIICPLPPTRNTTLCQVCVTLDSPYKMTHPPPP